MFTIIMVNMMNASHRAHPLCTDIMLLFFRTHHWGQQLTIQLQSNANLTECVALFDEIDLNFRRHWSIWQSERSCVLHQIRHLDNQSVDQLTWHPRLFEGGKKWRKTWFKQTNTDTWNLMLKYRVTHIRYYWDAIVVLHQIPHCHTSEWWCSGAKCK